MGPRLAERLRHGESGLDDGVEAGVEREGVEVRVGGLEVVLEVGGAAIDEIFLEIAGTSREEGDGRGGEMEVTGGEAEGRAGPAVGGDVVGEGSAEELGLETLGGARGLLVHPGVGGRGAATPRRGGEGKTDGREGGREGGSWGTKWARRARGGICRGQRNHCVQERGTWCHECET